MNVNETQPIRDFIVKTLREEGYGQTAAEMQVSPITEALVVAAFLAGAESVTNPNIEPVVHEPELKNIGARLCIRAMGKYYPVRAIYRTDAEANRYMAKHPETALIDEDSKGNRYIADKKPIDI